MAFASSSALDALRTLGARLHHLRVEANLSGRELGRLAGWHSSKISKIEHGRQVPTPADIHIWCQHCQQPRVADELIATLHAAEGMFVEWRRLERAGLTAAQDSVRELWAATSHFRIYSGWVVPGPLQTRDYITAVLNSVRIRRRLPDDPDDLATAVQARLDRQALALSGNRRIAVLLEEHVLCNPVGGAETMTAQLGYLLTAATLPCISLGIIPLGTDRTQTRPVEGFWIYDDRHVTVELVSGHLTITQPHELALYNRAFGDLAALAVHGAAARATIRKALEVVDSR